MVEAVEEVLEVVQTAHSTELELVVWETGETTVVELVRQGVVVVVVVVVLGVVQTNHSVLELVVDGVMGEIGVVAEELGVVVLEEVVHIPQTSPVVDGEVAAGMVVLVIVLLADDGGVPKAGSVWLALTAVQ